MFSRWGSGISNVVLVNILLKKCIGNIFRRLSIFVSNNEKWFVYTRPFQLLKNAIVILHISSNRKRPCAKLYQFTVKTFILRVSPIFFENHPTTLKKYITNPILDKHN